MKSSWNLFLFILILLNLHGCGASSDSEGGISGTGGRPNGIYVNGTAEKGPFLKRSEVTYSYVDSEGVSISENMSTETSDDMGSFSIGLSETGLLNIRVQGYHYNELNGQVSDGPLTLTALYEANEDETQIAKVNVLTHLIRDRIFALIESGLSIGLAMTQAEQELLTALDNTIPKIAISDFNQLSIYNNGTGSNEGNAYLLLLSAALHQHAHNTTIEGSSETGQLTSMLNSLADDFTDGDLEASAELLDGLTLAIQQLDPDGVVTNLKDRSNDVLGEELDVPDFSDYIGQFLITYPAEDSLLSEVTPVRLEVPSGIRNVTVDLIVDGITVDSVTESPYQFSWDPYYWSFSETSRHTLLVKASNTFGGEVVSNLVSISVAPENTTPFTLTAPQNEQRLSNTNSVSLEWLDVTTASEYQVQVATDTAFSNLIEDTWVSDLQLSLSDLNTGTYHWRIRAKNSLKNTGPWSLASHFTIEAPQAPSLASPANNIVIRSANRPTLIWNAVEHAVSYQVQIASSADFSDITHQQTVSETELTTPTLKEGNYYWRIYSIDGAGHISEASTSSSFELDGPVPPELTTPSSVAQIRNSNTATLRWNTVQNAQSYQVQLSPASDFSTLAADQVITSNNFSTEALSAGRYYWRVKGLNSFGFDGLYSSSSYFDITGPLSPTPALPSDGTVVIDSNTTTLSWNEVDYAENYIVQISTSSSFSSLIDELNSSVSNVTTTALSPTNYYWRIKAENNVGNDSAWSSTFSFTISAPQAPSLTSPIDGVVIRDTDTPTLTWSEVENATNYKVQVSAQSNFSNIIHQQTVPTSEHTTSSLAKGLYYWRVISIDVTNYEGNASSTGVFELDGPVAPALASPSNATLIKDTNSATLSWNTAEHAENYQVQLAQHPSFVSPIASTTTTENQFSTESLDMGRYYWRARSINRVGFAGDYSSTRYFDISGPDTPTLSLPSNSTVIRDTNTPTLSWDSVDYAASYTLQISDTGEFTSLTEQQDTTSINTTTNALNKGSYYWRVKSVNAVGHESAYSEVRAFEINGPEAPSNITTSWSAAAEQHDTQISWNAAEHASSYVIEISTTDDFQNNVASIESSTLSAFTLLNAGNYFGRIRSVNSSNVLGEWLNTFLFEVGLFRTQIGGSGSDRARKLISLDDRGYLVFATTNSNELTSTTTSRGDWVFHLDEQGRFVKEIDLSSFRNLSVNDILQSSNGDIYLAGTDRVNNSNEILRFNSELELVWHGQYSADNSSVKGFHLLHEWNGVIYTISTEPGEYTFDNLGRVTLAAKSNLHTIDPDSESISGPTELSSIPTAVGYDNARLLSFNADNLLITWNCVVDSNGLAAQRVCFSILDQDFNQNFSWVSEGGFFDLAWQRDLALLSDGKFIIAGTDDFFGNRVQIFNPDGSLHNVFTMSVEYYEIKVATADNNKFIAYTALSSDKTGQIYQVNSNGVADNPVSDSEDAHYINHTDIVKNQDSTATILMSVQKAETSYSDLVIKRVQLSN